MGQIKNIKLHIVTDIKKMAIRLITTLSLPVRRQLATCCTLDFSRINNNYSNNANNNLCNTRIQRRNASVHSDHIDATFPPIDRRRDVPFQQWWPVQIDERGTKERPILVPSLYDQRTVTCFCSSEDSSTIYYVIARKGEQTR